MLRKTCLVPALIAAIVFPAAIEVVHAASGDDVTPPPVPSNLEAPAGNQAFLIAHAYGTQNYSCLPSGRGVAWTFFGPQATLFDADDDQLITHFLSPNPAENDTPRATWQHSRDTSRVWAVAIESSTDPAFVTPGAIPWLLLRVTGAQAGPTGGDRLTRTTYLQRVNTAGGIPPDTGCRAPADVGRKALVPYTADYIFYRD